MFLRGRRIENFLKLWWLVASGVVGIWVSSTSFQKSNISWPQQPLTKNVVNFNMIFHESTKSIFFQNIKIKLNSRTWMTLKSSVEIFQTLEPLQPQWPPQPQQPPWPQWPLQPHFIKNITDCDGWIIHGTKMTNTGPFWGMDGQKSNFLLILALFLSEAVEARGWHFFENWWMKCKCPLLLKPLATIVQENSQSFYLSEQFRIIHFTMRHPVWPPLYKS